MNLPDKPSSERETWLAKVSNEPSSLKRNGKTVKPYFLNHAYLFPVYLLHQFFCIKVKNSLLHNIPPNHSNLFPKQVWSQAVNFSIEALHVQF